MRNISMKNLMVAGLVFASVSIPCFAAKQVTVTIGREELQSDVKAQIIEGRTMLPLRAVFEAMNVDVKYDDLSKEITATKDDTTVKFTVGSNMMSVNGESKELDVSAMIVDNRTLVPVRACAESFGMDVKWDEVTKTVKIKKGMWLLETSNSDSYGTVKYEYDDNGNVVCVSDEEYWNKYEYDENDNLIRLTDSENYSCEYTYDENKNMVYQKASDESWCKYEYDEDSNLIKLEDNNGEWYKYEYNENGNVVYGESNQGTITKYEYDDNDNLIYQEESEGTDVYWTKYTYDNNKLVSIEDSQGTTCKDTYDEKGNLVCSSCGDSDWTKYTYDENGNVVTEEYSDGSVVNYTYIYKEIQ